METTKSTQQALQSVEIQVGELAKAVTQFMSRREKSFVEAKAQEKCPIKENESREKDEEKDKCEYEQVYKLSMQKEEKSQKGGEENKGNAFCF